jgi:hypothetical protein
MLRVAADESEAWGVRAAALQFLLAAAAVPSAKVQQREQQQQRLYGGGPSGEVEASQVGKREQTGREQQQQELYEELGQQQQQQEKEAHGISTTSRDADGTRGSTATGAFNGSTVTGAISGSTATGAAVAVPGCAVGESTGAGVAALAPPSSNDASTSDTAAGARGGPKAPGAEAAAMAGTSANQGLEEEELGSIPGLPRIQVVGLSFLLQRQQLWEVVAAILSSVAAADTVAAGPLGLSCAGTDAPPSVCSAAAAALCVAALIGDPEGVGRELLQQQQVVEGLVRLMQGAATGVDMSYVGGSAREGYLGMLCWLKLG